MNRLHAELHRLYLPRTAADPVEGMADAGLIGPSGQVRAMVLALSRPASWEVLSAVWRGVQVDLELPAPAIAVSGDEAFQLWFSLAEPVSVDQAHAFLERLRLRFLPEVAGKRIGLMPMADASAPDGATHARMVPAEQASTGNWSAFLAPDLAPIFDDTPWLDIPPGEDGQAELLRRLDSIKASEFDAAMERLRPPVPLPDTAPATGPVPGTPATAATAAESPDPRHFLLQVMKDPTVALALRIEAAKALLPFTEAGPPD
jgi:hypothetical protein